MTDKARYTTNFGNAVANALDAQDMTTSDLAHGIHKSLSHTTHMLTGYRRASAKWADLVADTLNLPDKERQRLHVAAAKDHGFKLDLTKKGR